MVVVVMVVVVMIVVVIVVMVAVVEVMFGFLVNVKTQPNPVPFADCEDHEIMVKPKMSMSGG